MPSLLDEPVPVTWVLARPMGNGVEFFAGLNVSSALSLTPAFYLARRFPTARAAYDFAAKRRDLLDFIVTRRRNPGRQHA
jgi:hypothetical protein